MSARYAGGAAPTTHNNNNHHHQQQQQQTTPAASGATPSDYAQPLHVDCSVEYELPECTKPPQGVHVEPLLMIHPCHFRNLERQRRRPFENNLPGRRRTTPSWEPYRQTMRHSHHHHQQPPQQPLLPCTWHLEPPYLPPPPLPLQLPCYEAV